MEPDESDEESHRRPIGALVGLVVIVLLVLAALWLVRQLHTSASMQDCLASGRTNCAPVETPGKQ